MSATADLDLLGRTAKQVGTFFHQIFHSNVVLLGDKVVVSPETIVLWFSRVVWFCFYILYFMTLTNLFQTTDQMRGLIMYVTNRIWH